MVLRKAKLAKERSRQATERAELEKAEKRKRLNASGPRIGEINFHNSRKPCSSVLEALSTELQEDQPCKSGSSRGIDRSRRL